MEGYKSTRVFLVTFFLHIFAPESENIPDSVKNMTKKERKELASDIENRLDNELSFQLYYELSDYHENGVSIVDVDVDIQYCEDYDDDWDEQVEDIISSVVDDWGGWYSWEGSCISVSIPD